MAAVDMKALLEAGVHFGHRTQKWDPRMKPYIFTERNGIHIIDLQQTVKALEEAYKLVRNLTAEGRTVLFVGTKRQALETVEAEAKRCGMPYVTVRWLGGMLTNWQTMRQRITELENLERMGQQTEAETVVEDSKLKLTKREMLHNTHKAERLQERFGGIRTMAKVPDMLFVVDVNREETAVKEANILGIPVLALVDTNCNPSVIDHVIPSNDDAIRAIKLMVSYIADAAMEGASLRKDKQEQEPEMKAAKVTERRRKEDTAQELSEADLLGQATLAKVAVEQAKEEAVAVAKAAKAAQAEASAEKKPAKKPVKKAAAKPKTRKPKTKLRKSDLEGAGEESE